MFSISCTHLYPLSTIYVAFHECSDVFFYFVAVRYTFDVKVKNKIQIFITLNLTIFRFKLIRTCSKQHFLQGLSGAIKFKMASTDHPNIFRRKQNVYKN